MSFNDPGQILAALGRIPFCKVTPISKRVFQGRQTSKKTHRGSWPERRGIDSPTIPIRQIKLADGAPARDHRQAVILFCIDGMKVSPFPDSTNRSVEVKGVAGSPSINSFSATMLSRNWSKSSSRLAKSGCAANCSTFAPSSHAINASRPAVSLSFDHSAYSSWIRTLRGLDRSVAACALAKLLRSRWYRDDAVRTPRQFPTRLEHVPPAKPLGALRGRRRCEYTAATCHPYRALAN